MAALVFSSSAARAQDGMPSLLPERGRFALPAPYGTEGIRVTNASDCGGSDCVEPVAGPRSIDAHAGRDEMLIVLDLRGVGPALFRHDKRTGRTAKLGPLFPAGSPFATPTGKGWYFSARRPATLYLTKGPRLLRYHVLDRTFEAVFDATGEFGEDRELGPSSSSDDDDVHAAVLRDSQSAVPLGCLVHREALGRSSLYPATGALTRCGIDGSGRWLVAEETDGDGVHARVVDVETGAETHLRGWDGAGGHSATGSGYVVAAGDGAVPPTAVRVWRFDQEPPQGETVYDPGHAVGPIAHPGAARGLTGEHACAPTRTATSAEIVCFRLDGSGESRRLAPVLTLAEPRVESAREHLPAGNLDATGRYYLWVGHAGGRRDAFMVKVPADFSTRGRPEAAASVPEPVSLPPSGVVPDPLQLPVATTAQVPLTAAYNALNVPARAAGSFYLDPTTGVKVYKLTSASYPAASANWGHDYAEGGDEVSLPYAGETRAVLVRQNGGTYWLIDFTPGVGVGNPRPLTGPLAPHVDVAFAFSNNPATPYYAYVGNGGSTIRRFDIRTMTEAPGGGWPVTGETGAIWLHQSANDEMFVWMRSGSVGVAYQPATGIRKTFTTASFNEPRIDRGGRYVGVSVQPGNILRVWDWNTGGFTWSTPGNPGIPFGHSASLKRRWVNVDQNVSYPPPFALFIPDVPNSAAHFSGPANATLYHCNGNWIQTPADLDDQWAMCTHYGSLRPPESYWLAPGAFVLLTANGQRRTLGHPYNTTNNYTFLSFPKFSADGRFVLFTSNMNGAGRSDVFLAELPSAGGVPDTTPPTVSLTAPANGATVSGPAVTVSASASDNVGVVGVQFKLDGANLGAEDAVAPYAVVWDTLSSANGSHTLTAVARDAAGNVTTSAPVVVTVNNLDTTPPTLSGIAASGITSTGATITWTTNEPADSQVEYGLTTAYGSSTPVAPALVTSHAQALGGLAPASQYHYRVKSRDGAGNLAVSGDFTFTTLSAAPPAAGPIAHWKLDEGAGTTSADASGNGHVATLLNGAAWATGRFGSGLSLDGIDDYARAAHAGRLDAFPLSVAVWFKTTTTAGVRGLVNKYVAGSYNGYQIFFDSGALCAWFLRDTANYVYDGSGCSMRTPGYNDGQWHHAVFTVDAAGGRLYVDAILKASRSWTGAAGAPTTTQDLRLGHYPGAAGGAEYLPGLVDDVRIYERALTATEVSQMYYSTNRPPIAHWKLDEGTGRTAADASGNGHTATLMNGAAWAMGRLGRALSLDGINDYARASHAAALNAFPLSVAAWFRTATTAGVRGLVNKYVANSYNGYQVFFDSGALCAWFLRNTSNYVYDGTGCSMRTPGYNDGQWHHAVFVVDAAGGRLYVDAVLKQSRPWTGGAGAPTTSRDVRLGHYPRAAGGAEYLSGTIDDVRIYDRAVTAEEGVELFMQGS